MMEVLCIHRIAVLKFVIKLYLRLVVIWEFTMSVDVGVILIAVVNLDIILGSDRCCLLLNQFPLYDGIIRITKTCLLVLVCCRLLTTDQVPLESEFGWRVPCFFDVLSPG